MPPRHSQVFLMNLNATEVLGTRDGPMVRIPPRVSAITLIPEHTGLWADAFGRWAFHHFNPRGMREAQRIERRYLLSETGHNLSTVLHTLFSDRAPAFEEIEEFLKGIVPTVERLLSPIEGEALTYAAIREKGVPKRDRHMGNVLRYVIRPGVGNGADIANTRLANCDRSAGHGAAPILDGERGGGAARGF